MGRFSFMLYEQLANKHILGAARFGFEQKIIGKEVEMPRQVVTAHRLIARLNEELANGNNSRNHSVSAVIRVDKEENSGCNWSVSAMSCFGSFSSAGNREAERVIESFQGLYNLHEGSVIFPAEFHDEPKTGASA